MGHMGHVGYGSVSNDILARFIVWHEKLRQPTVLDVTSHFAVCLSVRCPLCIKTQTAKLTSHKTDGFRHQHVRPSMREARDNGCQPNPRKIFLFLGPVT